MEILIQLIPSMKNGVEKGIEKTAMNLGTEVQNIYIKNTIGMSKDILIENALKRNVQYAATVSTKATSYISSFYKFIPFIGNLISGAFDAYSTHNIGLEAIKYFEEFIKKSFGCDYLIKQKNIYSEIFKQIELMIEEEKWDKFPIQIIRYEKINEYEDQDKDDF